MNERPKLEIKYTIPEININIDDNNAKEIPSNMDKLFNQFENMENLRTNSLIMTEISNSRIQYPSQIMNSAIIKHKGIKCQKCGKFPIIGHRYKCPKCLNYDLCEECEQNNAEINFHPHLDFILCRIPETSLTSNDYSYECLTENLEIHQNLGVESFNIKLRLKNNGYLKWPEGKSILKCRKENSTIFCDKYNLPSIDMNDETDIVLNFNKCSKIPKGKYTCYVYCFIDGKIRRGPIVITIFID